MTRVKIGVAGKIFDGRTMAASLELGAEWCNSACAFMFALGCVQTRECHIDACPTVMAKQNRRREAGLVVESKAPRVISLHRETVDALADYVAAAGLAPPSELRAENLRMRQSTTESRTVNLTYRDLDVGGLLSDGALDDYVRRWAMADPNTFLLRQLSAMVDR